MTRPLLAILLAASAAFAGEPIRACRAIKSLTAEAIAREPDADLQGVVSFVAPGRGGNPEFILSDATGGIYVYATSAMDIRAGRLMRVTGKVNTGLYAPVVSAWNAFPSADPPPKLPPAPRLGKAELLTGRWDCERVIVSGIVIDTHRLSPALSMLELDTAGGDLRIFLANPPATTSWCHSLVGARIEAAGVCTTSFNLRAELNDVQLSCAGTNDVSILAAPAPDPFDAEEVQAEKLFTYSPAGYIARRIRLGGVVTAARAPDLFYLQNARGRGIRVRLLEGERLPAPGDRAEASGFVDRRGVFAGLRGAHYRVTGHGPVPAPASVTRQIAAESAAKTDWWRLDFDGRLVSVRGTVRQIEPPRQKESRLLLECGGLLVSVIFAGGGVPADVPPGSVVEATGICQIDFNPQATDSPPVREFSVWTRTPADVRLIRRPPWWTPGRLMMVMAGLFGVIALIGAWALTLRRTVRRRTLRLEKEISGRVAMQSREKERLRLAAELHDTLEQDLTGVALQLQSALLAQRAAPERTGTLIGAAMRILAAAKVDLRDTLWNLRGTPPNRESLTENILEIAQRLAPDGRPEIDCNLEALPPKLPARQVVQIAGILREALTNAVKHAMAGRIIVGARANAIFVEDDGVGFDPKIASAPGHFGLVGMGERAQRMNATLRVERPAAGGTRLIVEWEES